MGFPKVGGTILGVPAIQIILFHDLGRWVLGLRQAQSVQFQGGLKRLCRDEYTHPLHPPLKHQQEQGFTISLVSAACWSLEGV